MKICLRCQEGFSSLGWVCPACGYEPECLDGAEVHAPEFANGGGGFKSEYFSKLVDLEAENFWFRARNELIIWALQKYKSDAQNFLEVGCGTGFVLSGISKVYPAMELHGSEIFLSGLSHASVRVPSAHFLQMDARRVPFLDEFDAIGAFDVLEHIEEDEVVLSQLRKALRPGGVLLLTVPQRPWLWSASDEYACHVRRYARREMEEKISDAGFEVLRSTSFVTSLLPMMMISRLKQRRMTDEYNPANELNVNSTLNGVLFKLMMAEIRGIKNGLNYPLGGSRLVVAVKGQWGKL